MVTLKKIHFSSSDMLIQNLDAKILHQFSQTYT